jgi:hypothetical protein
VTDEDYIDTDEIPPGGCRGQGKFETWDLSRLNRGTMTPLGTWETELNGMFTGGAVDSKAPVRNEWFGQPTADSRSFQPHVDYGFMCPVLRPDVDTP